MLPVNTELLRVQGLLLSSWRLSASTSVELRDCVRPVSGNRLRTGEAGSCPAPASLVGGEAAALGPPPGCGTLGAGGTRPTPPRAELLGLLLRLSVLGSWYALSSSSSPPPVFTPRMFLVTSPSAGTEAGLEEGFASSRPLSPDRRCARRSAERDLRGSMFQKSGDLMLQKYLRFSFSV